MYVAAYRRRKAIGKEQRKMTRRQADFDRSTEAEAWLEQEMKNDPRAEIGCVRRGDEVVRILYAG